jgi:hypothetical protein
MIDRTTIQTCIDYLSDTLDGFERALFQHLITEKRKLLPGGEHFSFPKIPYVDHTLVFFVLPTELCWALACDFAEHVIPILFETLGADQRPQEILRSRRQWLLGGVSDEVLKRARELAYKLMADATCDTCALSVTGSLLNCVSVTRPCSIAAAAASDHAITAAQLLGERAQYTMSECSWSGPKEKAWQVDHLRHVLTAVLLHQEITDYLKLHLPQ